MKRREHVSLKKGGKVNEESLLRTYVLIKSITLSNCAPQHHQIELCMGFGNIISESVVYFAIKNIKNVLKLDHHGQSKFLRSENDEKL